MNLTDIDICYSCQSTNDLRSTGNSDGFVCATCISDPDNTNAFCVKCLRYEETDDFVLCGKCQFINDSDDEEEEEESHVCDCKSCTTERAKMLDFDDEEEEEE